MLRAVLALGALTLSSPTVLAAPAPATIAASPLHTSGAMPTYPRLTAFPDPVVMARVNAALTVQEKTDRQTRADCLAQIRDQKQTIDKDSFAEDVQVTYLGRRYLSVNVVSSYDCAGAYPTAGAEAPLTYDLSTGAPVTWSRAFKPGFLPKTEGGKTPLRSVLARLYWRRLSKTGLDPDCRTALADVDPFDDTPTLWLVAGRGLAVQPQFNHAMAVCAETTILPAADLAPYVRDANLLAALTAKAPPRRPSPGAKP
jgi:hypothetical protein